MHFPVHVMRNRVVLRFGGVCVGKFGASMGPPGLVRPAF